MYYIYGQSGPSLLIESTDSMILYFCVVQALFIWSPCLYHFYDAILQLFMLCHYIYHTVENNEQQTMTELIALHAIYSSVADSYTVLSLACGSEILSLFHCLLGSILGVLTSDSLQQPTE